MYQNWLRKVKAYIEKRFVNGQAQGLPLQYPTLLHFRKPTLPQFFLMLDTKNPVSHRSALEETGF